MITGVSGPTTFVHRDVISLATFDFVLPVILTGVVDVPLIINVSYVHFDNYSAHVPSLRVSSHVIANFLFFWS